MIGISFDYLLEDSVLTDFILTGGNQGFKWSQPENL
jgi:hypothetical protein